MPRDGSGVYSKPAGTTASPNTTIESSKYNSVVDDLVSDANAARPVTAGGTGETTARLKDGTWRFQNTSDPTKLLAFDLSAIPTATTRTLVIPAGGQFVGTDAQTFTAAQQGQARANIGAGVLTGFRNKLMNTVFRVGQRATSGSIAAGATSWVGDRWQIYNGTDQTMDWQLATGNYSGQPGYVRTCLGTGFAVAPTTGVFLLFQNVEGAAELNGDDATFTGYYRFGEAALVQQYVGQRFGSGGSADVDVFGASASMAASSSFTKRSDKLAIPSTFAKTFGTGNRLNVVTQVTPRHASSYDFTAFSLVPGDDTQETDPLALPSIQEELAQCQRYGQFVLPGSGKAVTTTSGAVVCTFTTPMRTSAPTFALISGTGALLELNVSVRDVSAISAGATNGSGVFLQLTTTGLTANNPVALLPGNFIFADAEL